MLKRSFEFILENPGCFQQAGGVGTIGLYDISLFQKSNQKGNGIFAHIGSVEFSSL